jgi:hypothetical protein
MLFILRRSIKLCSITSMFLSVENKHSNTMWFTGTTKLFLQLKLLLRHLRSHQAIRMKCIWKIFRKMYICQFSSKGMRSYTFNFYYKIILILKYIFLLIALWYKSILEIWCDFGRASSLICGNKIPTRCNRRFLLQILLLVQHVSGTTMPIIRSSRVLYRWSLPVVFGVLVFKYRRQQPPV